AARNSPAIGSATATATPASSNATATFRRRDHAERVKSRAAAVLAKLLRACAGPIGCPFTPSLQPGASPMSSDVVILSYARTPIGRFQGGLASFKAPALGAIAIKDALRRREIPLAAIDEVVMG